MPERFFTYVKVCLQTRSAPCYFVHAKIAYKHACTQSMYIIVVFINAHKLHFTLNIFLLSLFTYFYKILHNSFCQFVNNLYHVLINLSIHKYLIHILTITAMSILSAHVAKIKVAGDQKTQYKYNLDVSY